MTGNVLSFLFLICAVSGLPPINFSQTVSGNKRAVSTKEIRQSADDVHPVCYLPAVNFSPISCAGAFPKWTYNAKTEVCEQFIYGGCGATKNLFNFENECLAKCNPNVLHPIDTRANQSIEISPCLMPKAPGNCRASIKSFYFEAKTEQCSPFIYTGCRGNANNFLSMEDCQQMCQDHIVNPVKAESQPTPIAPTHHDRLTKDVCNLPPVTSSSSSCVAFILSWTFNATSGQCESYIYGGCGKTANLFQSEEVCKATCESRTRKITQNEQRDICLLPIARGPCFGHALRYGFIKEKNRCEMFTFGGCNGNKNNFRLASECFAACGGNLPSPTPECEHAVCPTSNQRYIEMGCLPEYYGNACCPTSFTCSKDNSLGVCHYRGVSYKVNETISQVMQDNPCKANCTCEANAGYQGGATINCLDIYCDMPRIPEGKKGCVLVRPLEKCCPHYKFDDNDASVIEEISKDTICRVKDKEYTVGQYIQSGDPCLSCRCVEDFNGLDEHSCREIHCLIDNRIGCVPVFTEGVCCPTSYKCADKVNVNSNSSRIIHNKGEPEQQEIVPLDLNKPEECNLPKAIGPCKGAVPLFFYNSEKGICESFWYGGCKGNANRFETLENCQTTCLPAELETPTTLEENTSNFRDHCKLIPDAGPCGAVKERFYYNFTTDECQIFKYGGCRGNKNNFLTIYECHSECRKNVLSSLSALKGVVDALQIQQPQKDIKCNLPADPGFCRAYTDRYFYDGSECRKFVYGGCGGNFNNFHTVEECSTNCIQKDAKSTVPSESIGITKESKSTDSESDCSINANVNSVQCIFGNFTLNLGDFMLSAEDPCEECVCSTPPEITCTQRTCPPPPHNDGVCRYDFILGQCCPTYSCVSSNSPFADACEGIDCEENEHCEVQQQDNDGNWETIKGVCMENEEGMV